MKPTELLKAINVETQHASELISLYDFAKQIDPSCPARKDKNYKEAFEKLLAYSQILECKIKKEMFMSESKDCLFKGCQIKQVGENGRGLKWVHFYCDYISKERADKEIQFTYYAEDGEIAHIYTREGQAATLEDLARLTGNNPWPFLEFNK